MVIEGELKKRVFFVIDDLAKDDEHKFAARDLVNIQFDEAKKDIFQVQYVYYKPRHSEGYCGNTSTMYKVSDKPKQGYKKHVSINEEAVKKWFGDSS
jgi:hypothetical protein